MSEIESQQIWPYQKDLVERLHDSSEDLLLQLFEESFDIQELLYNSIDSTEQLKSEYGNIYANIWKLKQLENRKDPGVLGRLILRRKIREPYELQYFDDPYYSGNNWFSPDVMIATPPILEEFSEDRQSPTTFGWSFAVNSEYNRDLLEDGKPTTNSLVPIPTPEVTVYRTARDFSDGTIQRQQWYTIYPDSSSSGFANLINRASDAETTYQVLMGEKSYTETFKNEVAKQHAFKLALKADDIISKYLN